MEEYQVTSQVDNLLPGGFEESWNQGGGLQRQKRSSFKCFNWSKHFKTQINVLFWWLQVPCFFCSATILQFLQYLQPPPEQFRWSICTCSPSVPMPLSTPCPTVTRRCPKTFRSCCFFRGRTWKTMINLKISYSQLFLSWFLLRFISPQPSVYEAVTWNRIFLDGFFAQSPKVFN